MLRTQGPHRAIPFALALLVGLGACVPATTLPDDCEAAAVTRDATLVDERMEPVTLEVCRGQDVTFRLDVQRDATFHIHGYDEEAPARDVSAGETVIMEFNAVRSGQFEIAIHTVDGPAEATVGSLIVHEG
jgi:hypothetical protein